MQNLVSASVIFRKCTSQLPKTSQASTPLSLEVFSAVSTGHNKPLFDPLPVRYMPLLEKISCFYVGTHISSSESLTVGYGAISTAFTIKGETRLLKSYFESDVCTQPHPALSGRCHEQ